MNVRPPPGYPFAGDIPGRPLPDEASEGRRSEQLQSAPGAAFILAFAGAMMGAGFMLVAVVSTQARHAAEAAASPASTEAPQMTLAPDEDGPEDPATPSHVVDSPLPASPPIERNVPVHPVRFLEGCSAGDLETIERVLRATIEKGAPLYNDGDVAGCAEAYERGVRELETGLPPSCGGPLRALAEGRAAAGKQSQPNGRAWAFRDAFDGLIEILDRSRTSGVTSL